MTTSLAWIKEYVPGLDVTPQEYMDAMTLSGSTVEGYEVLDADLDKIIVGEILSIEKHPDADKLVVCMVDVGRERPVQIVTGASNVRPGALVPAALDGSVLPGGVRIGRGNLRGVESEGMLCSLNELGLTVHDFPYAVEDGIFLIEEP